MKTLLRCALHGILIMGLAGLPEIAAAQTATSSDPQTSSQTATPAVQPAAESQTDSTAQQQPAAQQPAQAQPAEQQSSSQDLPNSPGAIQVQSNDANQSKQAQPSSTERPLGTAAAEIGSASGTTASRPAGVAIAPAKQRQSRSLLIKVGALLGVGVAVGTVFALSNASPSRPPGAQ